MIQLKGVTFRGLQKLSVTERLKTVKSSALGTTIISALTPSQFADLFPLYYRRQLPDISGFLKAIPSSVSQKRAAYYDQQIQNTVRGSAAGTGMKKFDAAANYDMNKRSARVLKKGEVPIPQLSPDQLATYNSIKQGQMDVNDPKAAFLKNLNDDQLKAAGLSKVKDETGKEVFKYMAPTVTTEQAIQSLKSASSSDKLTVDLIKRKEGFIDTPKFDVNHMRVGYGSDTITLADGTVKEVVPGMKVSKEDAERDLLRRIPQFQQKGIVQYVGQSSWDKLNPSAKAAITSLAYNYGSIGNLTTLQQAIKSGDHNAIADAVAGYSSHGPFKNGRPVNYDRRMEEASMIRNSTPSPTSDPITKSYSNEAVAAEQQRLTRQVEANRVTSLAGATTTQQGAVVTPSNEATSKLATISSYKSAGTGYCGIGTRLAARDLFGDKYFNQGLGAGGSPQASSLSRNNNYFQDSGYYKGRESITKEKALDPNYLSSLPIGTVISAQGGNVHGDGHVQIKLGANKWVSYFDQNSVLGQRKDGRQYDGYSIHVPNEKGMKRIQEQGYATTVAPEPPPPQRTVEEAHDVSHTDKHADKDLNVVVDPAETKVSIKPTGTPDYMTPSPEVPKGAQSTSTPIAEPKLPPKEEPTVKPQKFNFNKQDYLNEVGKKHSIIDSFAASDAVGAMIPSRKEVWRQTVQGLKDAEAKGVVKFNEKTGELVVNDMNHPEVQKILKDMKDNELDRNAFMKQIEEKKVEAKKVEAPKEAPKPVQKVPEAPKPLTSATSATPTQTQHAPEPKPETVAPAVSIKPETVPTKATGGTTEAAPQISAYPIGGLRGDNSVVVDANQKPLFTMNTKTEAVMPTGASNQVNVVPSQKGPEGGVAQAPDPTKAMRDDIHQLKEQISKSAEMVSGQQNASGLKPKPVVADRDPQMINQLLDQIGKPYRNPTAQRAFSRARFVETGDATNDFHHSIGNSTQSS